MNKNIGYCKIHNIKYYYTFFNGENVLKEIVDSLDY